MVHEDVASPRGAREYTGEHHGLKNVYFQFPDAKGQVDLVIAAQKS